MIATFDRAVPKPGGGVIAAISATTAFFVFAFGILLTLVFPKLGREDLSPSNLLRKMLGAVLIAAAVVLVEAA